MNHQIRVPEVRLIDEQNKQVGVVPLSEALRTARERGLDLVEVSPVAKPPVCRIVDFGKFMYQMERQDRKSKSKVKRVEVKGIRLSLTIGEHDLEVRRARSRKFLNEGHKVKIEIILRGRENQHRDRARKLIEQFIKELGGEAKLESSIALLGNRFNAIVTH